MDCEEYREGIGADPSESFSGGAAHAAGCADCSRYRDELRALDRRIAAALAIDVPPLDMPSMPPLAGDSASGGSRDNVVDLHAGRPAGKAAPVWFGIAASVAVAAFLGYSFLSSGPARATLAEQVIAHMDYEQASRRVTSVAVPHQELYEVINPKVSELDVGIGLVSYAQSCVINGNTVPHLVIQGESGPVTLILMPEEPIDRAISLSGEHVHGVIVPVGSGSVAIIGERAAQLDEIGEIRERIVESVEWRI